MVRWPLNCDSHVALTTVARSPWTLRWPHFPDFATFSKLAATADYVPVYRRLLSDALTPVSAFHKIDDGGSACLFESVIGGEKVGRYSFLAAEPFLLLEAHDDNVKSRIRQRARADTSMNSSALKIRSTCLRERVQAIRVAKLPELPPFAGGAVGYAGYDTVRYVETPAERAAGRPPPARSVVRLLRPHGRVRQRAEDGDRRRAGEGRGRRVDRERASCAAAYDDACRRVDRLVDKLSTPTRLAAAGRHRHRRRRARSTYESNFTQAEFEDGRPQVRRVHPRRRHLSGRDQPAAGGAARGRSVRDLSHAAGREPQPVHVLPADARVHARRQLAGDHGPRGRRQGDGPAAGRHAPPRRDRRGRPAAGRGAAGRSRRSGPST